MSRGVMVSESVCELLTVYIQTNKQYKEAIILKNYPVVVDDNIYIAGRINGVTGVIMKTPQGLKFETEKIEKYICYIQTNIEILLVYGVRIFCL